MFHLMDRVPHGVQPMIAHLESHVITTGLADMIGAAATIATVRCFLWNHKRNMKNVSVARQ